MRSAHVCAQAQDTFVVQSSVAGWIFQPAGYELDAPKTADVKLPVSGASCEGDGLAMSEGLDEGGADGEADGGGDGDAAAPGPVPADRNGPTTARTTAPTAITAAAASAALADMFMAWNLRGTRISTRRCRVVSME